MGPLSIAALVPGFVAASVGYLVFVGFGDWGGLDAPGMLIPALPAYDGVHLIDLVVAVAVGMSVAVVITAVHLVAARVDGMRGRLGMPALLVAGGCAVGLLALAADALGADPRDVLFSGQSSVPVVAGEDSTRIVLILVVAKLLAYAISVGCGFRGGPIFPAMFLGVALASLGVIWFDISPTFAIAVGAAAGMAAQAKAIVSSLLFAVLLVGPANLDAIPGAVFGVVAAWLTVMAIEQRQRDSDPVASDVG